MAITRYGNRREKKNRVTLKNQPRVFVGKVYAEWCGHCREMAPEWSKMKKQVNGRVKVVDILETVPSKKCGINLMNLEVSGFPTIFKTKNGGKTFEYYSGQRVSGEMSKWAVK